MARTRDVIASSEAERAAQETLALPVYAELADDQKAAVVDAVAEYLSA